MENSTALSAFIKYHRAQAGLTQQELAAKAGVGLRLVREIEQGKLTLRLDTINKVLALFEFEMRPDRIGIDPYALWRDYMNEAVTITLTNRQELSGILIGEVKDEFQKIAGWKIVPNAKVIAWQKKHDRKLEKTVMHKDILEIRLQE